MRSYYLLFIINVLIATGHAADGPSLTGEEHLKTIHTTPNNEFMPCYIGIPYIGHYSDPYRLCPFMALVRVNKENVDQFIPDSLKTSLNGKTINTFFAIQNRYDGEGKIALPLNMVYHPWVAQYEGNKKFFKVDVNMGLFDTEGIQGIDLSLGSLKALQVNFHSPIDYSPNNAQFNLSNNKIIRFISAATYGNHAIVLFHLLINDHDIAKEVLDLINYSNMTNNKIGNLITGLDNYSLDDETDKNSILWWTKKLATATGIAAESEDDGSGAGPATSANVVPPNQDVDLQTAIERSEKTAQRDEDQRGQNDDALEEGLMLSAEAEKVRKQEELEMQKALMLSAEAAESEDDGSGAGPATSADVMPNQDVDLQTAIERSEKTAQRDENQRRQNDDTLEEVLRLSAEAAETRQESKKSFAQPILQEETDPHVIRSTTNSAGPEESESTSENNNNEEGQEDTVHHGKTAEQAANDEIESAATATDNTMKSYEEELPDLARADREQGITRQDRQQQIPKWQRELLEADLDIA